MSESFYPITGTVATALTFEQEITLLKRWKKRKHAPSRDALIKNYLLFTVKQVKRMYPSLPEDDAILVSHEAVMEAIDQFDPYRERLGRLSNLIPYHCRSSFRNFRRRAELVKCPLKEPTPEGGRYTSLSTGENRSPQRDNGINKHAGGSGLSTALRDCDGSEFIDSLSESVDSAAEDYDAAERKEIVLEAFSRLPDNLREVLKAVYFEGLSFADVARQRVPEITREAVRQQHSRAIVALRELLKKKEILLR